MRRTWALALAASLLLGAFILTVPRDAQAFTFCGEEQFATQLRFHNPDLNPWNDAVPDGHAYHNSSLPENEQVTESSWQFFIQFQSVVNTSSTDAPQMSDIESFWFAFGLIKEAAVGPGTPGGPGDNCEKPWLPGFQLYSYRGDADPSDGFFVPINTTAVPDNTYGAAVFACTSQAFNDCWPDGDDDLVAAAWTRATVYNAEDQCPTSGLDPRSDISCQRQYDFIKPWPLILPGDGSGFTQPNADACASNNPQRCITIEFAERLATTDTSEAPDGKTVRIWINGLERTDDLDLWTPPARDNDLILGNDRQAGGTHPARDCSTYQPIQEMMPPDARACQKVVWGDGFKLDLDKPLTDEDTVRVWAMDQAGNPVTKTINYDDPARGGVIPLIDADVDVAIQPALQKVRPSDAKAYDVTLWNNGTDFVHTFPTLNAADELTASLSDDHVDIEPKSNETITLTAGPKPGASEGDYPVQVVVDYISGSRRETATGAATIVADNNAELSGSAEQSKDDGEDDGTTTQEIDKGGLDRQCSEQGKYQICFVYPKTLQAGASFPFEVQTAQAGEVAEQRHDVSVGEADLTMQYLGAEGRTRVAEDETYQMTEESTGTYTTDVELAELAPMLHAVFDSEKASVTMMIRQPDGATEDTDETGATLPGFEAVALLAAGGAALWIRRRD